MVMSAFVVIPTYNVRADEPGCLDYDDTNGNGAYDADEPCHDDDDSGEGTPPGEGEGCMDYDDINGNGLYDADEPCYDNHDDDDFDSEFQSVLIEMISLSQWDVIVEGEFSAADSNNMREMVAEMCGTIGLETPPPAGTISQQCLDKFLEMANNDSFDDYEPDMCGHFGLTDEQCEDWNSCREGGGLQCIRVMYDMCSDADSPGPHELCENWNDGDDEGMTIFSAFFDYEAIDSPSEDQATQFLEAIEATWGDDDHDYPEKANYVLEHFDISQEDDGFSYELQIHGQSWDDSDGVHHHFETGPVYLYSTNISSSPGDSVYDSSFVASNHRDCKYVDESDDSVHCSNSLFTGPLGIGEYTLLISNYCHHDWQYNESSDRHDFVGYDCGYGPYNFSVVNESTGDIIDDGYITGNITSEDPMFDLNEMQVTKRKAIEEMAYFPLYETFDYGLYATEWDGTPAKIGSEQTNNMVLWMYDGSFDPAQWEENLVAVSSGHENHDGSDDIEPCNCSSLDLSEFPEGSYVFVITSEHTYGNGSHETKIYSEDGTVMEEWNGTLCEVYNTQGYDCDNPGDDDERGYAFFDYHRYYQNDDHDNDADASFGRAVFENITAWKDGSQIALHTADNIVDIFYQADAAGEFSGDDSHCDDGHCDDSHCEDGHCGGDSHCDDGHCGEEHHCDDGHCDAGDGPHEDECPFTDQETCEELQYLCNDEDDGGNPVMCGWEVAHYCLENEDSGCDEVETACTSPVSTENASICAAYNDFDHDAFHTEHDDDGSDVYLDGVEGEETPHNWDNEGLTVNPENVVGNVELNNNLSITQTASFVIVFDPVDATLSEHVFEFRDGPEDGADFHCWSEPGMNGSEMKISFNKVNDGTEDCGDGADEPQDMDGDGTNDSWFNCNDPSGTNVNMEKTNDGTEDCPNGADEGVNPYDDGDDPEINATFSVLPGYEIVSCNNCTTSSISADKTTVTFTIGGDDEFSIVFMKSLETSADCDHVIGIDSTGFAFDPMDLAIDVGDTVCWQWTDATDAHNVLELKTNYESGMNITEVTVTGGFTSGEPSNTVDFRQTFNTDDQTHYYVCVPHAESMSMVGRIVVGNGTEDDPIQEAIEESGLPSIGFVVGVLVLVGAAGLRRRVEFRKQRQNI